MGATKEFRKLTRKRKTRSKKTKKPKKGYKKAVGRTKKHFIYPKKLARTHRFIPGNTGAGKTTLIQTLMEIAYYRGHKVVEIEPAIQQKSERNFMNIPQDDPNMLEDLKKYFNLSPDTFKTRTYTIVTPKYKNFINASHRTDLAKEFFRSIKIRESDIIEYLPEIYPTTGDIIRIFLEEARDLYTEGRKKKSYRLEEFKDVLERVLEPTQNKFGHTWGKIKKIKNAVHSPNGDYSIQQTINQNNFDEISVFTPYFIDSQGNRLIFSIILIQLIYEKWNITKGEDDLLSFFISDAHELAPKNVSSNDPQKLFKKMAAGKLESNTRMSRGMGIKWNIDSQRWDDIDSNIVGNMESKYVKMMNEPDITGHNKLKKHTDKIENLKVEQSLLKRDGKIMKIRVRPPRSKKASTNEHLPDHSLRAYKKHIYGENFIKQLKKWDKEIDNYKLNI